MRREGHLVQLARTYNRLLSDERASPHLPAFQDLIIELRQPSALSSWLQDREHELQYGLAWGSVNAPSQGGPTIA